MITRRDWAPEEVARLRRRRADGATLSLIARELGRSPRSVEWQSRKLLPPRKAASPQARSLNRARAGLPSLNSLRPWPRCREEFLALYRLGWTDARIGRRLGAHQVSVLRWRRAEGLPPNGKGGPRRKGERPRV